MFTLARHSKITRFFILVSALAVLVGLLIGVPVSAAHAEAGSVTINAIGSKTARYHTKYSLSPSYTKSGDAVVDSATITVTKGKKTVAKDTTMVSLAPGAYTVTQKVSYRPFSDQTRQELVVAAGSWVAPGMTVRLQGCTITSWTTDSNETGTWGASCMIGRADVGQIGRIDTEGTWTSDGDQTQLLNDAGQTIFVQDTFTVGIDFAPQEKIKATTSLSETITERVYGASVTVTKTEKLTIKAGHKDCATYADYKKVKASKKLGHGSSVKAVAKRLFTKGTQYYFEVINGHTAEVRVYESCSAGFVVAVGFIDGHAYTKAMGSA